MRGTPSSLVANRPRNVHVAAETPLPAFRGFYATGVSAPRLTTANAEEHKHLHRFPGFRSPSWWGLRLIEGWRRGGDSNPLSPWCPEKIALGSSPRPQQSHCRAHESLINSQEASQ